jgi:hypothetical protein
MGNRLDRRARQDLADAVRGRYRAATGTAKRKILDEFIATTGYHEKAAIRVLRADPSPKGPQSRVRAPLYDEAVRAAVIVLWEASDRVCGKRLRPLLPILLPALERNGHLRLQEPIRDKVLAMSASTIDRLLRAPKSASRTKKPRRVESAPKRRIPMRTFADWNEPPPGSMEMDLVAHCGDVNRGSYVHSLVLTDIASGWTECAPLVVREGGLVVETIERIRHGLPFPLRALDVDNGTEFVNDKLIDYCLSHGIELTRSRPYRKNDQAWVEQKNGAIVRKLLGYRRFEGLGAARVISRLYGASRLFVNFFQPSFKLATKHRDGAKVSKRYHPPQTPCDRLLQAESTSRDARLLLQQIGSELDPLKLLEEIRALQAHLAALADGEVQPAPSADAPDLPSFLASLSSAWRAGEVRPTFSIEAKPRYLRGLQRVAAAPASDRPAVPDTASGPTSPPSVVPARPAPIYASTGQANAHAVQMVWPIVCRRLEGLPNISAAQLFDELSIQFPGRFTRAQYKSLLRRVNRWREDARARGIVIGSKTYRRHSDKPRGRKPRVFKDHWIEMTACLEAQPDQTAQELLIEFQARHPGRYKNSHLSTLQKYVRMWRQQEIQRLICDVGSNSEALTRSPTGNTSREATGNKVT